MPAVPATLVGNLVAAPEVKRTEGGTSYTRFRVAVNDRFRDASGEWKDHEPIFWTCEAWKDAAEIIAAQFKTGSPVIVNGTFRSQSWETAEGEKRSRTFVRVEAMGPNTLLAQRRRSADKAVDVPADLDDEGPTQPAAEQPSLAASESWDAQA